MAATGTPSDNVFITDIPTSITEFQLRTIFEAYGQVVSIRMLPGPKSGDGTIQSALMRFGTVDEASWVVETVNKNIPQGMETPVVCRFANPPGGKDGGKGQGGTNRWEPYPNSTPASGNAPSQNGGKGKGKKGSFGIGDLVKGLAAANVLPGGSKWSNDDNTIFVSGLPMDTTDAHVYTIFSTFGAIGLNGACAKTSKASTIAFVNYLDPFSAQTAIDTLNGTTLPDGGMLTVKLKTPPKGKGEKGDGNSQGTVAEAVAEAVASAVASGNPGDVFEGFLQSMSA